MGNATMLMALLGGFAGSFHCIGMCGGFVCGLSRTGTPGTGQLVVKNLIYNVGRLTSYCFIGAVAGAGGSLLAGELSQPANAVASGYLQPATFAQRGLSVVAGVLMLLMALQLLGIYRYAPASWGRIGGVTLARMLHTLVQSPRRDAALALGVVNGFLPCPLVLSFSAIAAASAGPVSGVLIMFAFGLGTFPAMLFMGSVGRLLPTAVRSSGVRLSGALLILFSLFTIARGLSPLSPHAHAPTAHHGQM